LAVHAWKMYGDRLMSDSMRSYPVRRIVTHGPDLKSFYFDPVFESYPGQFVNLWIPGVDEKPFSISDATDEYIELSVKAVGPFTRKLMECNVGDYLGLRGPFGHGFQPGEHALLIGGGIGLAPIRYLSRFMQTRNMKYILLIGAKKAQDVIFRSELYDDQIYCTTEDGSLGCKGLVTQEMKRILDTETVSCICAAGPEAMLARILEIADVRGIDVQLSFERYMKCGIGICGQCCLDGSGIRVCVEGPVLRREEIRETTGIGLPHRDATGTRKTS